MTLRPICCAIQDYSKTGHRGCACELNRDSHQAEVPVAAIEQRWPEHQYNNQQCDNRNFRESDDCDIRYKERRRDIA